MNSATRKALALSKVLFLLTAVIAAPSVHAAPIACSNPALVLSASCRWAIVAASSGQTVTVRTGAGATTDESVCGDLSRWAGSTTGSLVVSATNADGILFEAVSAVDVDIVTGGAALNTLTYATIPGTSLKTLAGGSTAAKSPMGTADTTGSHSLRSVCDNDHSSLAAAVPVLNGEVATQDRGDLDLAPGEELTIDVMGAGLSVIDFSDFRMGTESTLTLSASNNDVVMLRVTDGRLLMGNAATIALTGGLTPDHVLIYVEPASTCKLGKNVHGSGTLFCPLAHRLQVGVGADWTGTFLGASKELRLREGAGLTHVPFTGF